MPREKIPTNETAKKRTSRKAEAGAVQDAASVMKFVDPERRAALVAEAAYLRAEQRHFAPGHEVEDWLAAESEVDAKLLRATGSEPRV